MLREDIIKLGNYFEEVVLGNYDDQAEEKVKGVSLSGMIDHVGQQLMWNSKLVHLASMKSPSISDPIEVLIGQVRKDLGAMEILMELEKDGVK